LVVWSFGDKSYAPIFRRWASRLANVTLPRPLLFATDDEAETARKAAGIGGMRVSAHGGLWGLKARLLEVFARLGRAQLFVELDVFVQRSPLDWFKALGRDLAAEPVDVYMTTHVFTRKVNFGLLLAKPSSLPLWRGLRRAWRRPENRRGPGYQDQNILDSLLGNVEHFGFAPPVQGVRYERLPPSLFAEIEWHHWCFDRQGMVDGMRAYGMSSDAVLRATIEDPRNVYTFHMTTLGLDQKLRKLTRMYERAEKGLTACDMRQACLEGT